MKIPNFYKLSGVAVLAIVLQTACTKLETQTYSVTPVNQFWQTQAQITAGEAPAYQQLQNIVNINGSVMEMIEPCTDEMLVPTRGGDWGDAGHWDALFYHTWPVSNANWDAGWQAVFTGVSKCNLIINSVKALNPQPANVASIYAGLKTLRAYYYYMAMDMFGNVPILTDTTTVSNIAVSPRATVYNFILSDLTSNLQYLPANVDASTYGLVTKYFSYALLARLYLNQQVFAGNFSALPVTPGTADWTDCINYCDSVLAGPYSLTTSSYFDNFAATNGPQITENIFCVPYDATNIQGNSPQMTSLHYNNNENLNLTVSPWNGFCATADFYYQYDTSSTYVVGATTTTRTFNDQRTGQWLEGAQFVSPYAYPPSTNVLVASTDPNKPQIVDNHTTDTLLYFNPMVPVFSDPAPSFHGAGVRNVKYWPGGQGQSLSNDVVVFRMADIMLIKAEALVRSGDVADAQPLLDAVRARAYGTNTPPALAATLQNIYWERARELAWEGVRREDMIRYEMATNLQTPYFSQGYGSSNSSELTNSPYKAQDVMDGHLFIFPIPSLEITANSALQQNPGYN